MLPADIMVTLYYSLVYSRLTYALLAWERSGRTNMLRLSVLTGEHANYSQIITIGSSLFTQFMIGLLYQIISTQIPLIFINISKTNYLLINHLICTTPDTVWQTAPCCLDTFLIDKPSRQILWRFRLSPQSQFFNPYKVAVRKSFQHIV